MSNTLSCCYFTHTLKFRTRISDSRLRMADIFMCCDGRVVKALDLKSNGIFPRRFEPCSQREKFCYHIMASLTKYMLRLDQIVAQVMESAHLHTQSLLIEIFQYLCTTCIYLLFLLVTSFYLIHFHKCVRVCLGYQLFHYHRRCFVLTTKN